MSICLFGSFLDKSTIILRKTVFALDNKLSNIFNYLLKIRILVNNFISKYFSQIY